MTRASIDFLQAHEQDDPAQLLLSASRYAEVDMEWVATQIEGRRVAAAKWPSLLLCSAYQYPPRLAREQSSSEPAARYKAGLLGSCCRVADLTGGMGVDAMALAEHCERVYYVEQQAALCQLMTENCAALGRRNIDVVHADCAAWLAQQSHLDALLIDPARRDAAGRKVVSFADCAPNVLSLMPLLRRVADRLLVKASPMMDIHRACAELGCVEEVHVVAVAGECKEVLFLCQFGKKPSTEPTICCVELASERAFRFAFTAQEEASAVPTVADSPAEYLYLPHAALMKGGCYRWLSQRYSVAMLGIASHLYTSDTPVLDFPGRVLCVMQSVALNKKAMRRALPAGRAHVVVRHFPQDAASLQRQLGLREGNDAYVVATSVAGRRWGLICQEITQ